MISHEHKCIFIHLQSTAGTWFERVINGRDWYRLQQEKPRTWFRHRKHLVASQARREYKDYWDDYFKFSFVRNPWSRMVSFAIKHQWQSGVTLNDDKLDISGYKSKFGYPICLEHDHRFSKREDLINSKHKPQSVYGNILDEELDFVGKFENIKEDFGYVLDKIKLNAKIKRKPLREYVEFYTKEVEEEVRELYATDIETYGYEFGEG